MSFKKVLGVVLSASLVLMATGCSSSKNNASDDAKVTPYKDIVLGEDFTDLTATITMLNDRTDMEQDDYNGVSWNEYIKEFNKLYPNITVEITTDTNYAEDSLTHLQSGDYETIMGIPALDKEDYSIYFMPLGDIEEMSEEINNATSTMYDGVVYGVPSSATAQGIVYNKKVFEKAGINKLPTTPAEFMDALKAIKDNTDAIPLYTNYAAGWTMGAWDAYIGINATGDTAYMNNKLLHSAEPFKDFGDDTHAYAVYKILYDAVKGGLTEEDYTTTDWEGCKGMINRGEIGCMVLGSWAVPQMKGAGDGADDIGYMAFPISLGGKQYALASADYSYAVNENATVEEKQAAVIFIKWLTEMSGYTYNEEALPIDKASTETKLDFDGVIFLDDDPAQEGEEDLLNELNSESELNFNNGGNTKVQEIVEHASIGDMSYDDIMAEWNAKWAEAQKLCGVEVE
ncbi:ABC transporter substrate-binding protein [Pseudobutyrivibrio sp.]